MSFAIGVSWGLALVLFALAFWNRRNAYSEYVHHTFRLDYATTKENCHAKCK